MSPDATDVPVTCARAAKQFVSTVCPDLHFELAQGFELDRTSFRQWWAWTVAVEDVAHVTL